MNHRTPRTPRIASAWIILFAIAQVSPLFADDNEYTRQSLSGLTSLDVVVEDLPAGATKIGLTKDAIRTDVELKLRLAGMRVTTQFMEYLYIVVTVADDADGAYIKVELQQPVTLDRSPISTFGATWSEGTLITNPSAQYIRTLIKDKVDKFLNAWLSVNPKK